MASTAGAHPPFAGVLLDLFGTLIPGRPRVSRAPHLHEMAHILGADPTAFETDWSGCFEDRVKGRLGSLEETVVQIARRQGLEPAPDDVRRAVEARLEFTQSAFECCRPVLPGLDALRNAGIRLAVVSDTSAEVPRLWPSTPLARRIEASVFSCEVGFCKPDPRMYRRALEQLDLSADRCAFVGDGGSRELTGAEAVGLAAFLYRFPEESEGPDPRYDPDIEWKGPSIRDLGDLLNIDR